MKSLRNRYSLSTKGINAQGFVSAAAPAGAVPATEGAVAFYEADTPGGAESPVDGTALDATKYYRVVQLQDGEFRSSVQFKGSDIVAITNIDYTAPVKQIDEIGFTAADVLAFLGTPGLKEFSMSARETTPANQPFPVIEGNAAIRNITTTTEELIAQLVSAFNNTPDYENNRDEQFAYAYPKAGVTGGPATATVTGVGKAGSNLIGVVAVVPVPAGSLIVQGDYVYTAANTAAVGENLYVVQPLIEDAVAVAAGGAGAALDTPTAIAIAAAADDVHFSTAIGDDLLDYGTITTAQAWVAGSGVAEDVRELEKEFEVFQGATTINAQWKEDFGEPTSFVEADGTYALNVIKYKKYTASMAFANEMAHHVGYIMLASKGTTAPAIALA